MNGNFAIHKKQQKKTQGNDKIIEMNALRPEHEQEHEKQLKSNLVSNKWVFGTEMN